MSTITTILVTIAAASPLLWLAWKVLHMPLPRSAPTHSATKPQTKLDDGYLLNSATMTAASHIDIDLTLWDHIIIKCQSDWYDFQWQLYLTISGKEYWQSLRGFDEQHRRRITWYIQNRQRQPATLEDAQTFFGFLDAETPVTADMADKALREFRPSFDDAGFADRIAMARQMRDVLVAAAGSITASADNPRKYY